jgi:hypothetical protein
LEFFIKVLLEKAIDIHLFLQTKNLVSLGVSIFVMAVMISQFSIDRDLFTKPLLTVLELMSGVCSSFFSRNVAISLGSATLKNQSPAFTIRDSEYPRLILDDIYDGNLMMIPDTNLGNPVFSPLLVKSDSKDKNAQTGFHHIQFY